jgi:protein ImuA
MVTISLAPAPPEASISAAAAPAAAPSRARAGLAQAGRPRPGLFSAGPFPAGPLPPGLAAAGLLSGGELAGRQDAREVVSSGFAAVDSLLPAGGVRRGSLLEWLAAGTSAADGLAGGAGAVSLACGIACRLARIPSGPQTVVVIDRSGWFHPPAVLPWLADPRQLVVARPSRDDDEIWAIDQALRSDGVAAVVAWPRSVAAGAGGSGRAATGQRQLWTTAMRRWQLAARSSGAVGLVVRPEAAGREPSWAEARLAVEPLPGGSLLERRLRLTWVGGGWTGGDPDAERAAETVLDLARGCAGRPLGTAAAGKASWQPQVRQGGRRSAGHASHEGGFSCRAS